MFTIVWLIVTSFCGYAVGLWQHFDLTISTLVGLAIGLIIRFAMKAIESFGDALDDAGNLTGSSSGWFSFGGDSDYGCGGSDSSGSCD
jgi:hypothetical protein